MGAEQGDKASHFVPAGLQFAPFCQVVALCSSGVTGARGSLHIAVFHAETADVHPPERDACHREVQACRGLCPHILPACGDVAAPCGGAVALLSGKARTGEEEDAAPGVRAALAVVDGVGIDDGVGVEVFVARAQGGGAA